MQNFIKSFFVDIAICRSAHAPSLLWVIRQELGCLDKLGFFVRLRHTLHFFLLKKLYYKYLGQLLGWSGTRSFFKIEFRHLNQQIMGQFVIIWIYFLDQTINLLLVLCKLILLDSLKLLISTNASKHKFLRQIFLSWWHLT